MSDCWLEKNKNKQFEDVTLGHLWEIVMGIFLQSSLAFDLLND